MFRGKRLLKVCRAIELTLIDLIKVMIIGQLDCSKLTSDICATDFDSFEH